eukprot:COSAG05_NODE_2641_length_2811_cov_2.720133_5_plen_98_part_00
MKCGRGTNDTRPTEHIHSLLRGFYHRTLNLAAFYGVFVGGRLPHLIPSQRERTLIAPPPCPGTRTGDALPPPKSPSLTKHAIYISLVDSTVGKLLGV